MATYLVTGCAGFIASKVSEFLLADGHVVVGVDNLNDACDVRLKQWQVAQHKMNADLLPFRSCGRILPLWPKASSHEQTTFVRIRVISEAPCGFVAKNNP